MAYIFNEDMRVLHQCKEEGWTFKMLPFGIDRQALKSVFKWCTDTYGTNRIVYDPWSWGPDKRWVAANINMKNADEVEHWIIGFREEKDLTLLLLRWGTELDDSRYLRP